MNFGKIVTWSSYSNTQAAHRIHLRRIPTSPISYLVQFSCCVLKAVKTKKSEKINIFYSSLPFKCKKPHSKILKTNKDISFLKYSSEEIYVISATSAIDVAVLHGMV